MLGTCLFHINPRHGQELLCPEYNYSGEHYVSAIVISHLQRPRQCKWAPSSGPPSSHLREWWDGRTVHCSAAPPQWTCAGNPKLERNKPCSRSATVHSLTLPENSKKDYELIQVEAVEVIIALYMWISLRRTQKFERTIQGSWEQSHDYLLMHMVYDSYTLKICLASSVDEMQHNQALQWQQMKNDELWWSEPETSEKKG